MTSGKQTTADIRARGPGRAACLSAVLTAASMTLCLSAVQAREYDAGNSMLILDASGSMWQRVEQVPKISIAREVLGKVLDELPSDQMLGLMAYGHRRKGDCSDIELLVEPRKKAARHINKVVAKLDPTGKTPLSTAVIEAAETMQYRQQKTTILLVSDGKETCDLNPCETGRMLEAGGHDLTVHVIGFAIKDMDARAQLRCLAENTGGKFFHANNATELENALLHANEAPEATLQVNGTASVGEIMSVSWQGPNQAGDRIAVAIPGSLPTAFVNFNHTYNGTPLQLHMPADAGEYEIRYVRMQDGTVLSRQSISVYAIDVAIDAPDTARVGETISLSWQGPGRVQDSLSIAAGGSADSAYLDYFPADAEQPLQLRMPDTPGEYEIRYLMNQDGRVLGRKLITVKAR